MPTVLHNDTSITSRAPKLYLKLEETSGAPTDFAGAGYGGTISVQGTPTGYRQLTGHGFGIRLGTGAFIQATHHSVFTTTGADGPFGPGGSYKENGIVESEVTVTAHVAFPVAPQDNWIIWSKAPTTAEDTTLTANTSLRVHLDGSVELRVREHKYKPDVRMRTEPGIVTMGSEHTFTVSLGYEGAWFSVDGRMANFGFKNNLAWWGWDHRHNGVEMGGTAKSTRATNEHDIRVGCGFDQTTSADIVVTKFAVFYSGATRIQRPQVTQGFTLAAHEAIAGALGSPLVPHEFPTAGNQNAAPGTNTLLAPITAASDARGGTVTLAAGTYTQTVNLVLPSRVRLTCPSGTAVIVLTRDAKITTNTAITMPLLTGGGTLSSGAASYTQNNALSSDSIFLVGNTTSMGTPYLAAGKTVHTPAHVQNDLIPIRSRTGTAITFSRAPYFNYPSGATRKFTTAISNPPVDIAIDGNITIRKTGGTTPNPGVHIQAARRVRFSNITIEQLTPGSSGLPDLLSCQFAGCVEVALSGCTVTTNSPDETEPGDQLSDSRHPYALQFDACANYDIFNHTGFSFGWHSIDHGGGNPNQDNWGTGLAPTAGRLWGANFGDMRNITCSSDLGREGNNFPAITHIANGIQLQDAVFTSGGGISVDGWGHNFEGIVANSGGRATQIAHTRGVGGTRIWHCTFNNNLGNWGNGKSGMKNCNYGNLHYQNSTPPQRSAFGRVPNAGSNVFTDVDFARKVPEIAGNHGLPF